MFFRGARSCMRLRDTLAHRIGNRTRAMGEKALIRENRNLNELGTLPKGPEQEPGTKNGERGAIIIEASMVLPFFMFFMITLYSVIQIAFTQSRMNLALDCATKELAQYTHVLYATGANKYTESGSGKSTELANQVSSFLTTIGDKVGTVHEEFGQYFNQAGQALHGDNLSDYLKFITGEFFVKQLMEKNMVDSLSSNSQDFLRRNRIDHWDMVGSKILEGESQDIFLRVNYDIKVIQLFKLNYHFHMSSCAYTQAWSGS